MIAPFILELGRPIRLLVLDNAKNMFDSAI
jgi:hypothetical protein